MHFDSQALWLLNISLAVILFGMALELSVKDFRSINTYSKGIVSAIIFQLVILPIVLVFATNYAFHNKLYAVAILLILLCPGGNMSNFLTFLAKGDVILSLLITAITTLLSIVSIPFLYTFYTGYIFDNENIVLKINSMEVVLHILLLLFLPLCIGVGIRYFRPLVAHNLLKVLKPLSLLIFAAFIIIVFASNASIFIEYFNKIFLLVGVIHLITFFLPYLFHRFVMNLSGAECKAISMELSIRNAALGLFLSLTYFKDIEIIAIICGWWGIYQLIAGYVYAHFLKSR